MDKGPEHVITTRFQGKRFEESGIPIEVYADLPAWMDLGKELVRHGFIERHPGRTTVPKHIREDFEMSLEAVRWEPEARIIARSTNGSAEFLQVGLDRFMATLGEDVPRLPQPFVGPMGRLYRHLEDGEAIALSTKNHQRTKGLTKEQMHSMSVLLSTPKPEPMSQVLHGAIYEVNKEKRTFNLEAKTGRRMQNLPLSDLNSSVVLSAFDNYEAGGLVRVEGVMPDDFSVASIQDLDIRARLEELGKLKDGWLFDDPSPAPRPEGLRWLSSVFVEHYYPSGLPLPRLFPTPEGNIDAQWRFGDQRAILTIDIGKHSGRWLWWIKGTRERHTQELDLNTDNGWGYVTTQVTGMVP